MSKQSPLIPIRLLDKTFHIKCPEGRETLLKESANYLHNRLLSLQHSSGSADFNTLLLSAAMNVTAELVSTERAHQQYMDEIDNKINQLNSQPEPENTEQLAMHLENALEPAL